MIIRNSNIPKTIHYPPKLDKCAESTNLINITSNIRYFSGFIKSKDNSPVINAIVSFTSIKCCNSTNNKEFTLLGYTKTDAKGYFSFYIDLCRIKGTIYKLEVFNPLTNDVTSYNTPF